VPRVYVGLGSNLGDREAALRGAVAALQARGLTVLALSPLYETEPWGITDQPRFLNAACALETDLPPHALLDTLKAIERDLGRTESVRYGPRVIDLDILLYGDLRLDTPRLVLPHPGLLQRTTALIPLVDLAPDLLHPVSGASLATHLAPLLPDPSVAPYPPGLTPLLS
jgi:2-amino-4-hydroxy-6-hydroxymethyldihydropteridine diphosphokinase